MFRNENTYTCGILEQKIIVETPSLGECLVISSFTIYLLLAAASIVLGTECGETST